MSYDQKQVDAVLNEVLALRPVEEHTVDIHPTWQEGDTLLNTRTGESFYIRLIDRERSILGIDPPLLHG